MHNSTDTHDIERALEQMSAGVDAAGTTRVIERVNRSRRRRRLGSFGAGAVAAALLVGGLSATSVLSGSTHKDPTAGGSSTATASRDDAYGLVEVGSPCPGAVHANTADGLRTEVPVWTAKNAELTDAWTCGGTPVLMYGAIQISYERGWAEIDAAGEWKALASEDGGSVETILGRPAYVHPATEAGPRVGVMFVVNGTLVRLLANKDVSVDEVVKLAQSLDVPTINRSNAGIH